METDHNNSATSDGYSRPRRPRQHQNPSVSVDNFSIAAGDYYPKFETQTGDTLILFLPRHDPVLSIKLALERQEGIPVCSQELRFCGKVMDERSGIVEYSGDVVDTILLNLEITDEGALDEFVRKMDNARGEDYGYVEIFRRAGNALFKHQYIVRHKPQVKAPKIAPAGTTNGETAIPNLHCTSHLQQPTTSPNPGT
ncbi:hypothetical protein BJ508DRAFT_338499 [Ascobolus immersus RN42]|uniref:Ubiquitin-like domain-containing protein n=1 Tax=Ascobolus immersus RN42 TaxID=1160509 RepID=A0A3N4HR51_ASCIM|nr:hypothetical protein BJ508DRAFT_338499 [Ascobolus immersus RN42]